MLDKLRDDGYKDRGGVVERSEGSVSGLGYSVTTAGRAPLMQQQHARQGVVLALYEWLITSAKSFRSLCHSLGVSSEEMGLACEMAQIDFGEREALGDDDQGTDG